MKVKQKKKKNPSMEDGRRNPVIKAVKTKNKQ